MTDATNVPAQSAPEPQRMETLSLSYDPKPGLGWLCIKIALLKIITLGIYSFWGKTNVRRHIWSCVHVMDEPLEYTGTGKELFLGFLIVVGIILMPLFVVQMAIQLLFADNIALNLSVTVSTAILFIYLVGVAVYRARRYRLSRTLWRGIRGTLTGSPWRFGWSTFWMTLTMPFTLFWTFPWMRLRLNSLMTNDMEFGSAPFSFSGPAGPLYRRYAIMWVAYVLLFLSLPYAIYATGMTSSFLGFVNDPDQSAPQSQNAVIFIALAVIFVVIPAFLVLGAVMRAYYVAGELRYFARCTGFENVKFEMNATTLSLIGLAVGNFFILLLTLGVGAPFMQQRLIRYMCDRVTLSGSIDVSGIQQSQAEIDKRGEGMAEVFDIDAF